jgi:two-component system KDP operon response regulator KdpE
VVDDDPQLLSVIRANLVAHGYDVAVAPTGEAALDALPLHRPDLLILDLGLPGIDGHEVLRRVRAYSETPVVVLSVRGDEGDKVRALDLGADDYLTKPFGMNELLARIRVALRHTGGSPAVAVLRTADFQFDPNRRSLQVRGKEVHLSPTEFELLRLFVAHPGRVLTHRWLLQRVWGPQYASEGHYLHVYLAGLRKKLEPDPRRPRYLRTEPGVGYRFELEAPETQGTATA